jgi:hypothetical protein
MDSRAFNRFLSLHGYAQDIAKKLPYPETEKAARHLLPQDKYHRPYGFNS